MEDLNEGKSTTRRMGEQSRVAMNSIYTDLNFVLDISEDFDNNRLPTLDFELFMSSNEG